MEISIIVPVYKVESYLRRSVDSILAQTFRDFELILVDDGSPDGCPQICDAYAEKDKRITVIHKSNGGLSDARNAGIDWAMAHSDSRWLAFVDSDDYLHPNYLQTMLDTAKKEAADLIICDFIRVDEQGNIMELNHGFFDFASEDKRKLFSCLHTNWHVTVAWNKLYTKHIFSQLRFAVGKIHEDSFAIHHVLWNCKRAAFVPDGLYYYRQRNTSIMATETPVSILDGFEATVERLEFEAAHGLLPASAVVPTGDFSELHQHGTTFSKQDRSRFRQLKKRYAKQFFQDRSNRSFRNYARFYFPRLYLRASQRFVHRA